MHRTAEVGSLPFTAAYLPWPSPQHRIMRLNLPFPSSTRFLVYLPKKDNLLRNGETDVIPILFAFAVNSKISPEEDVRSFWQVNGGN